MNIYNIKNDLNIFKNETLKALREMEKQLLEKIKLKSIETETKIADFDSKLAKFNEINKRMYDSVAEQQIYSEKLNYLNDFKARTETRLISFDVKLSNYLSDLTNIKTRYDKIFLEQLTVPGIIGPSCKFRSISDYLNDTLNNADQLKNEKELMKKQINELKSKNELFEKNLAVSVDSTISTCKLYTDTKINEIKDFFIRKIEEFDEILVNTKFKIEENVLKNEELSSNIKNEIKVTKDEITNLIEEKNKESEIIKNEIKKAQSNEIKKELNDMKKNFTELKKNMEKQMVNTYKIVKNKNKLNTINSNNSNKNINLFLKTNNLFNNNESEIKNNFRETEKIRITSGNINIENKDLNSNNNNNINMNNNIYNNNISNIYNNQNEIINEENDNNSDKEKENDYNTINNKEKYLVKIEGKNNKLRKNDISNINYKRKGHKNKNKKDFFTINAISNRNKNKEHKIIMPQKLTEKNDDLNNKNLVNIKNIKSRNKSFSKVDNNIIMLEEKNFSDEMNKNNINNNDNINSINVYNNNINFKDNNKDYNNKDNDEQIFHSDNKTIKKSKYIIHSIDGENTLKKLKNKITQNPFFNKKKEKKSIAIKLMKHKMQNINDINNAYLQQRSPTLGLYKEYYDKKIKEQKEKEKLNEIITKPKKVSPAFGRTAYIEFIKGENETNLKIITQI